MCLPDEILLAFLLTTNITNGRIRTSENLGLSISDCILQSHLGSIITIVLKVLSELPVSYHDYSWESKTYSNILGVHCIWFDVWDEDESDESRD